MHVSFGCVGLGMGIHVDIGHGLRLEGDHHPPLCFLRWGLSMNLELIELGWLASKPLRNACLCLLSSGILGANHHAQLCILILEI